MHVKAKGLNNYLFEDFISDDTFINFATNKNQTDIAKWEEWLSYNPINKQTAIDAKQLVSNLHFNKKELSNDFVTSEWNKLRKRLNLIEYNSPKNKKSILNIKLWQYVAAASILLLIASSIYYFSSTSKFEKNVDYHTVIVPRGKIKQITLPDGTTVAINSDSKLKYNRNFNTNQRDVFLEGEAWFDVIPNQNKPFVVHTHENNITVLGTAFNVYAYPNENIFRTSLEHGIIKISHNNKEIAKLKPNQTYILTKNNNKSQIVETANIESYSSWKNGEIVFNNQKFIDILQKLERSHNVIIVLQNKKVKDYRYTGTFNISDDIITILEVIKLPTPFDYEITENTIIIK